MKRRPDADQGDLFLPQKRRVKRRRRIATLPADAPVVHVVSLSGGRDSGAVGIWAAREFDAGRIEDLRYVYVHVGDSMEPDTIEWLLAYQALVLAPRGLALEILSGTHGLPIVPGESADAWFDFYEAPGRAEFLPSPLYRTCTHRLKVLPMQRWRRRELAASRVVWIIGFRADEANETRRVKPERLADGPNDELWYPFLPLGYGLPTVGQLLDEEGIALPSVYEWSDRSGCFLCFFKSKKQLVRGARRYPLQFEKVANHEERVIARAGAQQLRLGNRARRHVARAGRRGGCQRGPVRRNRRGARRTGLRMGWRSLR